MNNAELQARKEQAFARGMGNLYPFYVAKAENAEIWDVEGNRYVDFAAGIAVTNTGHMHPKVKAAVAAQLDAFSHTCAMVTPYASMVTLAESLNRLAPGNSPKRSILVTTGAEAVENAVKIARAHTGRPGVIAFQGGFHGRTNLTMGLTGKIAPYKAGFGPFPGEIYHLPFPIAYHGRSEEACLEALNQLFHCDIEPGRVAAIVIEPVQGEGGFYPAPASFMQALRRVCDEHGIVLICDEIQTGFARTGKLFATEYAGIEPDLITLAKGLAGGFPLAAVTGKAAIMDAANPGGLGGTYAASPLGCVAANAVLEVIEQEQLCHKALAIGEYLEGRLNRLKARYPQWVGEIRITGAMVAMELVQEGDANRPNPELTKAVIAKAQEHGLILLSCGVRANVIRILAPLTIPQAQLGEGADKLEAIFAELG
ncbi:4-aminobutyrate--2-oxoglutarate transaminase [Ferrimonas balearica]|uniref:4-aminobutyrate--2-oxoglutarate transaminase n=1 Tax=Ferrimonas balearica TaxID=44012 RepID=UPI001C99E963|nr:4-aminobutyrate--2-oxoglutarate transaminase [Ferrimonas balearica]MBY5992217.1 4-aminobutyrate--2-oxoglutarate transaminase [Ferrimonas balearica]